MNLRLISDSALGTQFEANQQGLRELIKVFDTICASGFSILPHDSLRTTIDALPTQVRSDKNFLEDIAKLILMHRNPGEETKVCATSEGLLQIDGSLGHSLLGPIPARGDEFSEHFLTPHFPSPSPQATDTRLQPVTARGLVEEMGKFLTYFDAGLLLKAEFSVDPLLAVGITQQIKRTMSKLSRDKDLSLFQEVVFGDAKAIGTVVSRVSMVERVERFLELAALLRKKERFSQWLKDQAPDRQLIGSYMDYIKRGTWVDRLPGKTMRFSIFSGAGILADIILTATTGISGLGTAAGVGIGVFDSLILDHLRQQWRPNQFIDGSLTEWVHRKN